VIEMKHPIVDAEFQALIDPLSGLELELLRQQIAKDGCLVPLVVWKTADQRILVDGHNRLQICIDGGFRYNTVNLKFDTREHAKLWILEHQVGRRNLTDDQRAVIWNEIREQRSAVASIEGAAKARAAKGTDSANSNQRLSLKEIPVKRLRSSRRFPRANYVGCKA
jgi:ParB-like chromosome segregation protein Spo0J